VGWFSTSLPRHRRKATAPRVCRKRSTTSRDEERRQKCPIASTTENKTERNKVTKFPASFVGIRKSYWNLLLKYEKKPWDKPAVCNWISKKLDVRTGFCWLKLKEGIVFSSTRHWTLSFHKGGRFLYYVSNDHLTGKEFALLDISKQEFQNIFTVWCLTKLTCFSTTITDILNKDEFDCG